MSESAIAATRLQAVGGHQFAEPLPRGLGPVDLTAHRGIASTVGEAALKEWAGAPGGTGAATRASSLRDRGIEQPPSPGGRLKPALPRFMPALFDARVVRLSPARTATVMGAL